MNGKPEQPTSTWKSKTHPLLDAHSIYRKEIARPFRIMLYAKNSWKSIMIEGGFDQPEAQSGCPIARTYTHDEVRALLKDYEIDEIRQDHIFPYVVEKYVRYEYEVQPWFKALPPEMFRVLEKALGWHTLIRARLKQS